MMHAFMTSMYGKYLRVDHSFKGPQSIIATTGSGKRLHAFAALFCAMDEWGRILTYQLCKTKETKEILPLMRALKHRYQLQARASLSSSTLSSSVFS